MTRLLHTDEIKIQNSKSVVTFEKKGDRNWYRYIAIEGKPAYEIGNICGTCQFYFERLEGANQNIHPTDLIEKLNNGIATLDKKTIEKVAEIIPNGKYKILFLTIYPKYITLGSDNDYFSSEDVKQLWDLNDIDFPHNPKTTYYRGTDQPIKEDEKIVEFIIPMFPQTSLDNERINFYKTKLEQGKIPTAISLSILDVKIPAVWANDKKPEYTGHWGLAHYLLDGHHKIFAAAELNKSINMICFLALEEGIYDTKNDIDILLQTI